MRFPLKNIQYYSNVVSIDKIYSIILKGFNNTQEILIIFVKICNNCSICSRKFYMFFLFTQSGLVFNNSIKSHGLSKRRGLLKLRSQSDHKNQIGIYNQKKNRRWKYIAQGSTNILASCIKLLFYI